MSDGVDRPGFMVVNAADVNWGPADVLGRKTLSRGALQHQVYPAAFSIVDRVIEDDLRFRNFLLEERA